MVILVALGALHGWLIGYLSEKLVINFLPCLASSQRLQNFHQYRSLDHLRHPTLPINHDGRVRWRCAYLTYSSTVLVNDTRPPLFYYILG